jgi:MraZ protein
MFRGRSVHAIDAKGRVSIPAGYRVQLQGQGEQPPILTNREACLGLYPWEAWHAVEQHLMSLSPLDPNAERLTRFMVSGATPCTIDKQGRILVPPALREYAGLAREVMVAGVGQWIELWDKARFDKDLKQTQQNLREIGLAVVKPGS